MLHFMRRDGELLALKGEGELGRGRGSWGGGCCDSILKVLLWVLCGDLVVGVQWGTLQEAGLFHKRLLQWPRWDEAASTSVLMVPVMTKRWTPDLF